MKTRNSFSFYFPSSLVTVRSFCRTQGGRQFQEERHISIVALTTVNACYTSGSITVSWKDWKQNVSAVTQILQSQLQTENQLAPETTALFCGGVASSASCLDWLTLSRDSQLTKSIKGRCATRRKSGDCSRAAI